MRDVATYKLPKTHVATLCIFALLTQRCYGVMIVPTKAREPQDLTAREAGREMLKVKKIFDVYTNERTHVLVRATQEELEKLFAENKIKEYTLAKIYKLAKEIA